MPPELGSYVTLVSGGSGQVVGIDGDRYIVRLSATEIEQTMSIDQFRQILHTKAKKD